MLHTGQSGLQVALIAGGAVLGALVLRGDKVSPPSATTSPRTRLWPIALVDFATLLIGLPILAASTDGSTLDYFDRYYRSGSLVFGGGHVVLPLLETEFVNSGVVSRDQFLAGYGAVQAMPGPLFTFASFLGTAAATPPNGIVGGLLATLGIFLPSLLLVYGLLPFWSRLRELSAARAALAGTNAVVVGLLMAAFYDPVWTAGITNATAFTMALGSYLLLVQWRCPVWIVVPAAALVGSVALG